MPTNWKKHPCSTCTDFPTEGKVHCPYILGKIDSPSCLKISGMTPSAAKAVLNLAHDRMVKKGSICDYQ